jgi:hypothetical protein
MWTSLMLAGLSILIFSGTAPAFCNLPGSCDSTYTDADAHPLRIVSYAIYPVGYSLEWLITRPIHALVTQPELAPIFGYSPDPWAEADTMMPQVASVTTVAPPPMAAPVANPADIEAARRAADEARAAAEEAKRAAEEAARAADKSTKAFEKGLRK